MTHEDKFPDGTVEKKERHSPAKYRKIGKLTRLFNWLLDITGMSALARIHSNPV